MIQSLRFTQRVVPMIRWLRPLCSVCEEDSSPPIVPSRVLGARLCPHVVVVLRARRRRVVNVELVRQHVRHDLAHHNLMNSCDKPQKQHSTTDPKACGRPVRDLKSESLVLGHSQPKCCRAQRRVAGRRTPKEDIIIFSSLGALLPATLRCARQRLAQSSAWSQSSLKLEAAAEVDWE